MRVFALSAAALCALASFAAPLQQQVLDEINTGKAQLEALIQECNDLIELGERAQQELEAITGYDADAFQKEQSDNWGKLADSAAAAAKAVNDRRNALERRLKQLRDKLRDALDNCKAWNDANAMDGQLDAQIARLRAMIDNYLSGPAYVTKEWCFNNLVLSWTYEWWTPTTFIQFECECVSEFPQERADRIKERYDSLSLWLAMASGMMFDPYDGVPE